MDFERVKKIQKKIETFIKDNGYSLNFIDLCQIYLRKIQGDNSFSSDVKGVFKRFSEEFEFIHLSTKYKLKEKYCRGYKTDKNPKKSDAYLINGIKVLQLGYTERHLNTHVLNGCLHQRRPRKGKLRDVKYFLSKPKTEPLKLPIDFEIKEGRSSIFMRIIGLKEDELENRWSLIYKHPPYLIDYIKYSLYNWFNVNSYSPNDEERIGTLCSDWIKRMDFEEFRPRTYYKGRLTVYVRGYDTVFKVRVKLAQFKFL